MILIGLVNNAALLLALGLLYDTLANKQRSIRPNLLQVLTGLILAAIGVAVMANPVKWSPGIIFDTRSVLLSVSGLFFGALPTLIAVIFTAIYRIHMGGGGALMGVAVITCSGVVGIAWRHLRRREVQDLSLMELYLFGVVVHVVMILCMFLLPRNLIADSLVNVGIPVMIVYPMGTALLGRLMAGRHARHRAEEALRASEEKYRELVENANSIILHLDRLGVIRFINEYGIGFFGFPSNELVGKPIVGSIMPSPESGGHDMARLFSDASRDPQQHQHVIYENICRDGRRVWVSWSNRLILDKAGEVEGMLCIGSDITEKKQAEDLLRENQEKFQQLFELSSDAIFLIDNETGRILEANGTSSSLYGYARHELLTLTNCDLSAEPEETRRLIQIPMRAGQLVSIPFRHHRKKDGTVFPVEIAGRAFSWQGKLVHIAAVRDITDRQRAEKERLRLERQMQQTQKLESLGVLAGGIAHDFNNLLFAILGNTDLALSELSPTSPARTHLEEIDKASHRAADLCRQMLAYAGKGQFVIETILLRDLIQEITDLLRASISKRAQLAFNIEGPMPPVRGDASQIRQVIVNLVTNASEAIGDKDGTIGITLRAMDCSAEELRGMHLTDEVQPGSYACIEVTDTGCGMNAATQQRIFEPFFTTKFAGRGLGLPAVHGIIRAHKGALQVSSTPNQGSSFRVLLPAAKHVPEPEHLAKSSNQAWRGSGTILLADDEPAVLTTCQRQLMRLGFDVITAHDGQEAINIFRERRSEICVVMLDLTMPHLDGAEALCALRAIDPHVRVVLCSGYTESDVLARFAGSGLTGFIQKPFTYDQLQSCLRSAMDAPANDNKRTVV